MQRQEITSALVMCAYIYDDIFNRIAEIIFANEIEAITTKIKYPIKL